MKRKIINSLFVRAENNKMYLIMLKKVLIVAIATAVLFAFIFFTFIKQEDLQVFPSQNLKSIFYDDGIDQGNSVLLQHKIDSNSIHFEYRLDTGFLYPYCGMALEPGKNDKWDFSEFNSLKFKIKSKDLKSIYVYFHVFDSHVKDKSNRLSFRRLSKIIELEPNIEQTILFKFDKFTTPSWWFDLIHQGKSDFDEPDYKKIQSIHFTSGIDADFKKDVGFEISEVAVTTNYAMAYLTLFGGWLLIVLITFLFLYINSKSKKAKVDNSKEGENQKVEIAYKPIEVIREKDYTFIEYINANFQDPDLTLGALAAVTGFTKPTISNYISENYNCNFKTYINKLRVNEAKRLLKQGGLASGEVAYIVGFNSPANFNRVFKSLVGRNPTEYMLEEQKV